MELIASIQGANPVLHAPRPLLTLGIALLFAAIYLVGGRASRVLGESGLRRFHSFAAGISVSYVFVYIMPELHTIREAHIHSQDDYIQRVFPAYSVYLSAMVGFMIFYGLENMTALARRNPRQADTRQDGHDPGRHWVHIGGFALYTWLIAFQIGRMSKGVVSLSVFALAMGLHIAPIANRLRGEHSSVYEHRGAILLALASLVGWACGQTLNLPGPIVLDMAAIVAGGVIVNTAIAELPKEREASFWSFCFGAVAYTALLLTLYHFEKGEA
jgi:hypothetical protein